MLQISQTQFMTPINFLKRSASQEGNFIGNILVSSTGEQVIHYPKYCVYYINRFYPNKRASPGICFIVKVKPWKHEIRVVLVKTIVKILKNHHLKWAVMQYK